MAKTLILAISGAFTLSQHVSNSNFLSNLFGQNFIHTFPIDMGPTYQKLAHFGRISDQLLAVTVRGVIFPYNLHTNNPPTLSLAWQAWSVK